MELLGIRLVGFNTATGHKVLLTITYRAHRYVGGNKLNVRVGSARKTLPFVLSR